MALLQNEDYTGWKKWAPTSEEWLNFESDGIVPFELLENEYLLIYEDSSYRKMIDQYCCENGKFRRVSRGSIIAAKAKRQKADDIVDSLVAKNDTKSLKKAAKARAKRSARTEDGNTVIYPRNDEQVCAFDLMQDDTKTVKLLTGTWGSGKTLILVAAALEALREGRFEKIIWIRNNVDVKDTKDIGALPGDVLEKLLPFLGPFIDHAGKEEVLSMLSHETLVVEPLQFLRGRNFENTLIVCSEAENLTAQQIQLIIARAADGSQVWFDADNRQRDRAIFEKSKGVETLIERLSGNQLFGYVHLLKSERSETAALADLLN